jgi:glycosyltransferase involved in cell wall biosynthesis
VSILFVHERAAFTGGVEQNIADTVRSLTRRGIACHLAYNPLIPAQDIFLDLFASVRPCNDLSTSSSIIATATLGKIACDLSAHCIYIHKIPTIPESILALPVRSVQMVHDHDLCCPRRHKYYAHNAKVCTRPIGPRCYLDAAFLVRDATARFGFRYESIEAKRREMDRRKLLDLSLVASEFMQTELLSNGFPPDRICVLPLAIPQQVASTNHAPSGTPTILYVGQLIRGKGVDLLLRALARIEAPFRAIIVGKGNAEAGLRKLSRDLGLSDRVEFAGWVNNEELPRYYALADVLAVPSRWPEPFGMVGLEAMRHGKPVVAFNVGGIPDWLKHERTGLLVVPGDVAAYATALQRLIVDRELAATLGAAGGCEVKKNFGFETYVDRLLKLLLPDSIDSPARLSSGIEVAH